MREKWLFFFYLHSSMDRLETKDGVQKSVEIATFTFQYG